MNNFLASAETVNTPSVQPTTTPPTAGQQPPLLSTAFGYLNQMLDLKLCTAIIKKQKMQYSILHFQDYNDEWMHCEVENLSNVPGDDLVLLVQKTTPIMLYMTGAVKTPFN